MGRGDRAVARERWADANAHFTRALERCEPDDRRPLLCERALARARLGDARGAVQDADEAAQGKDVGAIDCYNRACGVALAAASGGNADLAERYGGRAVELLRQAAARGYTDVEHLKHDPDLDALRGRPEFQKLVMELEAKRRPPGR